MSQTTPALWIIILRCHDPSGFKPSSRRAARRRGVPRNVGRALASRCNPFLSFYSCLECPFIEQSGVINGLDRPFENTFGICQGFEGLSFPKGHRFPFVFLRNCFKDPLKRIPNFSLQLLQLSHLLLNLKPRTCLPWGLLFRRFSIEQLERSRLVLRWVEGGG